jgi:hypothetical protein
VTHGLLLAAPGVRAVAIFEEICHRDPEVVTGVRRTWSGSDTVEGDTRVPHRASVMSSTRRTDTPIHLDQSVLPASSQPTAATFILPSSGTISSWMMLR